MTLIVGIKCQDGVVMAADSAATSAVPLGPATVSQKYTKLREIGDLIIGTSGSVGIAQAFELELDGFLKSRNNKCGWKNALDARDKLRAKLWQHAQKEWEATAVIEKSIGPQACQAAMFSVLIALPIQNAPSLIQFDHKCSPEEASDDLPIACIGSGQLLADPLLAFIRRVLWPEGGLPQLRQGELAALWAMEQAIRAAPAGIAGPVQIITLSRVSDEWVTIQKADPELDEHRQFITDLEETLRSRLANVGEGERDAKLPSPPAPQKR